MKVRVESATGPILAYLVAKASETKVLVCGAGPSRYLSYIPKGKRTFYRYVPHENWKQGGPIIERMLAEGFELKRATFSDRFQCFRAEGDSPLQVGFGPTPLVAAMRCYVASKLGTEVEVPWEPTP